MAADWWSNLTAVGRGSIRDWAQGISTFARSGRLREEVIDNGNLTVLGDQRRVEERVQARP